MIKNAIENTFCKRNTDIQSINKVIREIEKSEFLKDLWKRYSEKYQYAKNIKFEEIISSIYKIEKIINKKWKIRFH